jgi:plasmid maintenance system antidote protein VapI
MDKVKTLVASGTRIGFAIRQALLERDLTVTAFAEKYQLNEKAVSSAIHGSVRATEAVLESLSKELGGTPDEWRLLIWHASKPEEAGV